MIRADREVKDRAEIADIIASNKVMRMGLVDNGKAYIVPMNYGYSEQGSEYKFYIHSAVVGKKVGILEQNSEVCIEIDDNHRLTGSGDACEYSYDYRSIIAMGRARLITKVEEKKQCLQLLMLHQTGQEFSFTNRQTEGVNLYEIEISELTAKKRQTK